MGKGNQKRERLSNEWVVQAKQRLDKLGTTDPPKLQKRDYSKTEVVEILADEILSLMQRGFLLPHIAETISDKTNTLTSDLLKTYLARRAKRAQAKDNEHASVPRSRVASNGPKATAPVNQSATHPKKGGDGPIDLARAKGAPAKQLSLAKATSKSAVGSPASRTKAKPSEHDRTTTTKPKGTFFDMDLSKEI